MKSSRSQLLQLRPAYKSTKRYLSFGTPCDYIRQYTCYSDPSFLQTLCLLSTAPNRPKSFTAIMKFLAFLIKGYWDFIIILLFPNTDCTKAEYASKSRIGKSVNFLPIEVPYKWNAANLSPMTKNQRVNYANPHGIEPEQFLHSTDDFIAQWRPYRRQSIDRCCKASSQSFPFPPVLQTTLVPIILKIILKISAIESLPEKNSHTIRVLVYAVPVNQLPPLSLWSPHKTQMSNLQAVCEKDTVYGWTGARNSFRLRCWCNAAVLSPQSVQHMFLVIVHYFPSDTSIS